jgi:anti-sigma factor RsiW
MSGRINECWAEGELRAYLDRELAASEQEAASAHLKLCAECSGRYLEIAERAARVGSLMSMLPEPVQPRPRVVLGKRKAARAAVAVLALAAALAIGFVMLPRLGKQTAKAEPPAAVVPAPAPTPAPEAAPVVVAPAVIRHKTRQQPAQPVEHVGLYVPLDNEPIEAGTVMRVGMQNGDLQAEFILGPDGRAHAVRILSGK